MKGRNFLENFSKSFIFNLRRRNKDIWHVININICISLILNYFLWWYHVLLAVIRHLGYSTKPKVATEKHKFEKIVHLICLTKVTSLSAENE